MLVFLGTQFAENGSAGIESDPLISGLDVVKAGHVLFVPGDLDDALQFNTVLSIPYLVDGIVRSCGRRWGLSQLLRLEPAS